MELSKKEIQQMDSKDIFKLMLPIINDIYQQSKYIGISEQQFYNLALVEITNSKKTFTENISYSDFIKNKILLVLSEQIEALMTNQETQVRLIDNYINQKFTEVDNYKDSIKYLAQLTTFFEKYDIIPHPELITELVNKNGLFIQIIELIIRKFHSQITSGKLETIFDNSTMILIIETYCMLKNIEINEIDDYDNDSCDYETEDSMKHYLKEIGRIPMLSLEKEIEIAHQVAQGNQQAKQLLIESNLRLVVSIAKRYVGRGLQILDLIQEGNMGLMKAADRYDVNRGVKFSTFATWWIRQAITRAIQEKGRNIRIPVHMQDEIILYKKIVNKLEIKHNRQPTIEEIASEMKLPVSHVTKLYNMQIDTVSINTLIGDDSDSELEDFIPSSEENPEDIATDNSLKSEIRKLFDDCHLSKKEIEIIMLRYGFNDRKPMTLEEIGTKLGISREWVRQIEHKALKKLKNPKYAKAFVSYMQNPTKALESLQGSRNESAKGNGTYEEKKKTKSSYMQNPTKALESLQGSRNESAKGNGTYEEKKKTKSSYTKKKVTNKPQNDEIQGPKTIYQYFRNYTKEEIYRMLLQLEIEEMYLIWRMYGNDLNAPAARLDYEYEYKYHKFIVPKMIKILEELPKEDKSKTIYDYFCKYSKQQVDEMLSKLTDNELNLLRLIYGDDLKNVSSLQDVSLDKYKRFQESLIPKMNKLLKAINDEKKEDERVKKIPPTTPNVEDKKDTSTNKTSTIDIKPIDSADNINPSLKTKETTRQNPKPEKVTIEENLNKHTPTITETKLITPIQESNGITKDDYIKMLELLRTSTFNQIISTLTAKEAIIIALRLGYVNGKIFSIKSIATFLEIEETEVVETTRKILMIYKENINIIIDGLIDATINQVSNQKLL